MRPQPTPPNGTGMRWNVHPANPRSAGGLTFLVPLNTCRKAAAAKSAAVHLTGDVGHCDRIPPGIYR